MHSVKDNPAPIKVGIIGGRGYAGLEVVRLLLKHPAVHLRACFSTHPDFSFSDYLPRPKLNEIPVVAVSQVERWAPELNTVFLATAVEDSLHWAPKLLEQGCHVIDLSGAFRLNQGSQQERKQAYLKWYALEHTQLSLLDQAQYGLMPWLSPTVSGPATTPSLIANPGCYATAVLMALIPLLKRGLILPETLVIDAKSGTSGAGRKPAENLLFTEVEGECLPYRIGKHQHWPEICQFAEHFGGKTIEPMFTTHLLNVRRGILAGLYARVPVGVGESELSAAYAQEYSDYGLVEWGGLSGLNARSAAYRLSLKRIVGSARTSVFYEVCGNQLYLFSLLDNLLKGAASQAIENFNRLQGFSLGMGLRDLEGVL